MPTDKSFFLEHREAHPKCMLSLWHHCLQRSFPSRFEEAPKSRYHNSAAVKTCAVLHSVQWLGGGGEGSSFPACFTVERSCIGEPSQHVSMHVLVLCSGEESGSEQNQLEPAEAQQPRVHAARSARSWWGALLARLPLRRGGGRAARARRETGTLPGSLAAGLKQKLCEGENTSSAHPLSHPTQRGSQSKEVGRLRNTIRPMLAFNTMTCRAISLNKDWQRGNYEHKHFYMLREPNLMKFPQA